MGPVCQVRLRWLTAEEGGRKLPFVGGRYTPTARFAGEQDQFSVVLDFPGNNVANPTKGALRLLNPDLVDIQLRIRAGVALELMEGACVVARCLVESLDASEVAAAVR
jgi:hypothetical protein